jgi:hypothetical protein
MIENTLIELGQSKLKEKEITKKIEENTHAGCVEYGQYGSQLDDYFSITKEEGCEGYTFQDYCDEADVKMCPKCSKVLNLIRERKQLRRQISAYRGAITKYAISLVQEANK